MHADLSSAAVYTDFQGLAKLRAEAGRESPEALREVAKQFEALFLQMMMKSMRDAVPRDEGLLDTRQIQFFEGMYDQQLALTLSRERGIGLADVIYRQLGGPQETSPAGAESLRLPETRLPGGVRQRIAAAMDETPPQAEWRDREPATGSVPVGRMAVESPWQADSPEAYVRAAWPHAERAAARLGVAPEVLVAQSALETGWGRHVMRHADGRSSHNLFGIKADGRWPGERVAVSTLEYVDGIAERQYANFRSYAGMAQSFDDYADFIRDNPRYREALAAAGDSAGYLRGIQRAGYATDPAYADKILSILDRSPLSGLVAELKSGPMRPLT